MVSRLSADGRRHAMARQHMNNFNDYSKALHAFLPKEVVCKLPVYEQ